MAKTVDQYSTIEDFRKKYNELAVDVGDTSGLRTTKTATVVDALNSLEDKLFFFQEFIYTATASQTVFTGVDTYGTTLLTRKNKIQVYKNGVHLNEATQYTATDPDDKGNFDSITLSSAANAGDNITIYAFTGSFEGLGGSLNLSGQFTETAANAIYNVNSDGVILKGSSSNSTTTLQSGYTIQLAGKTYGEEDVTLAAGKTLSAPTITDNTLSINSGNITSGVTGTFSSTLTAGSFTDSTLTITGGDITGVDDITGTADSTFTAFKFIDKSGANLTGGVLTAGSLDISGNADVDGTMEADAYTVDSIPLNEYISDTVGAMVGGNTESGISVTYEDGDNTLDFNVDDFDITLTGDVAGTTTVTNLGDVSFTTTIQPNSVALATDTTGSYVATIADAGNSHITVANSGAENAGVTLNITDDAIDSAQIANNAVALGTQSTGNYVATIAGTANEITVSGSGSETAGVTLSLPDDVTIGNDLTVTGELLVQGDITSISTTNLEITDKLIVLGKGSSTLANTNDAGIQLGEHVDAPTLKYDHANTRVSINKTIFSTVGLGNDADALADINYNGAVPTGGQALVWDTSNAWWEPTTLGSTTDSYAEGTNNKYFTDDRVDDTIVAGDGLSKAYVDGAGVLDGRTTLSVNSSNGVKITGDSVHLDYETVSSAPTVVGSTATGHLWFVI